MPDAKYKLHYWPLPFRRCFITYLFAYRDEPLQLVSDLEENLELKEQPPEKQSIPYMGPPVLTELESGFSISQMPAIVPYVSKDLGLLPDNPIDLAMAMKVLMDCNDVLMEICRYNGSYMWDRDTWTEFRSKRLPRWMHIFEEGIQRAHFGQVPYHFGDIAVYALFGNMARCPRAKARFQTPRAQGLGLLRCLGRDRFAQTLCRRRN